MGRGGLKFPETIFPIPAEGLWKKESFEKFFFKKRKIMKRRK